MHGAVVCFVGHGVEARPTNGQQTKGISMINDSVLSHIYILSLIDATNKIIPDVAGYGRHVGALGYAEQGAKGNGI